MSKRFVWLIVLVIVSLPMLVLIVGYMAWHVGMFVPSLIGVCSAFFAMVCLPLQLLALDQIVDLGILEKEVTS